MSSPGCSKEAGKQEMRWFLNDSSTLKLVLDVKWQRQKRDFNCWQAAKSPA